jgi:hypothetical protein
VADITNVVEDRIQVVDRATGPLRAIQGQAGRLRQTFQGMVGWAARIGGIAGAFGIGKAVVETQQLYETIERVQAVTGMGAAQAHSMLDALELSGVSLVSSERLLIRMTKSADVLSGAMGEVAGAGEDSARFFKQVGIDIKAGPQQMLLQMADAVQQQKVGVTDLVKRFGIPIREAGKLMAVLQRGRGEMQRMMDETLTDSDLVTDSALKSFLEMQKARREMSDAWQEVVGTIYKAVLPAFTKVFRGISERMKEWAPAAQAFGEFLARNMETILGLATSLFKLMVANKALMLATGTGLVGLTKKMGRGAVAAAALPAAAGGPGIAMGLIQGLKGLMPLVTGLLKLFPLAALVLAIGSAFEGMWKHSEGVRKAVGKLVENVLSLMKRIADLFSGDSALGRGLAWFVKSIVWVLNLIVTGFQRIFDLVEALLGAHEERAKASVERMKKFGAEREMAFYKMRELASAKVTSETKKQAETLLKSIDELSAKGFALRKRDVEALRRRFGIAGSVPGERPTVVNNQDFRGSKFEITQEFAEGFDPTRVAVIMANDLAALGERRLQSGLAPVFAVR